MKRLLLPLLTAILLTNLSAFAQEKAESQSQAPATAATTAENRDFTFGGGTLGNFIEAIKKQLGFDLWDAATVDTKIANYLEVPKMKVPGNRSWEVVLHTYNELSRRTEFNLGSWVIDRTGVRTGDAPNAIVFMPPKKISEQAGLKVKAFSMEKFKDDDLGTLKDLIRNEAQNLWQRARETGVEGNFEGRITYHAGTSLLIASGGREYVELASTVVEAFKETLSRRRGPEPFPE